MAKVFVSHRALSLYGVEAVTGGEQGMPSILSREFAEITVTPCMPVLPHAMSKRLGKGDCLAKKTAK